MKITPATSLDRLPVLVVLACGLLQAGPLRAPLAMQDPLQDKNFFLLSAIERSPDASALARSDPRLAAIAAAKRSALVQAPGLCAGDVACYVKALQWSDDEIARSRDALVDLCAQPAMRRFIDDTLRKSGMFQLYDAEPNPALLAKAWEAAARKMNRALDVFALGQPLPFPGFTPPPRSASAEGSAAPQPPAFPRLQLTTYDVKTPAFAQMVRIMAAVVGSEGQPGELFFQPAVRFVVELLRLHSRDDAARYEPLEAGENRAAVARIPSINWSQYPYTVLVILGNGPEREGVALAPVGRLRLLLAMRDFRQKKAPFILVSGGNVHPNLTPYNEALEMKMALMREFGVPENAILVDPHARRTTTNLRNAVRLMVRYGIPPEGKALVVTDQLHSASLDTNGFRERCVRDFGYPPVRFLARISPFDLEFVPLLESLHADASDLLDP